MQVNRIYLGPKVGIWNFWGIKYTPYLYMDPLVVQVYLEGHTERGKLVGQSWG